MRSLQNRSLERISPSEVLVLTLSRCERHTGAWSGGRRTAAHRVRRHSVVPGAGDHADLPHVHKGHRHVVDRLYFRGAAWAQASLPRGRLHPPASSDNTTTHTPSLAIQCFVPVALYSSYGCVQSSGVLSWQHSPTPARDAVAKAPQLAPHSSPPSPFQPPFLRTPDQASDHRP